MDLPELDCRKDTFQKLPVWIGHLKCNRRGMACIVRILCASSLLETGTNHRNSVSPPRLGKWNQTQLARHLYTEQPFELSPRQSNRLDTWKLQAPIQLQAWRM